MQGKGSLTQTEKRKSLSVRNTSTGSADEGKVYKTPQPLGNSVSRVKQVLPNSPRKRRAVISKLAKSVDGILCNSPNPHRNGNKQLRKSSVKCVQDFCHLDSISRRAPGRKDYVSVRSEAK